MNKTIAIARRELTERRFVFIAATAFMILSLIIPLMPLSLGGMLYGGWLRSVPSGSFPSIASRARWNRWWPGRKATKSCPAGWSARPLAAFICEEE